MSAGFFIFLGHLLEALPTKSSLSVDRNLILAARKRTQDFVAFYSERSVASSQLRLSDGFLTEVINEF